VNGTSGAATKNCEVLMKLASTKLALRVEPTRGQATSAASDELKNTVPIESRRRTISTSG
jgi:hypothetical protein